MPSDSLLDHIIRPKSRLLTLQFLNADSSQAEPLPALRVQVKHLDANGKPKQTLYDGRTNAAGKVVVPLASAPAQPPSPQPPPPRRIWVAALDVDGDKLFEQNIHVDPKKDPPPFKVSVKAHEEKLNPSLGDGSRYLGAAMSPALNDFLKRNKVAALADLLALKNGALGSLVQGDRDRFDQLKAHARLQLISRDEKANAALIDKGYGGGVFTILQKSQPAFAISLKGTAAEARADKIYSAALRAAASLTNLAISHRVAQADRREREEAGAGVATNTGAGPACDCGCMSALSPLAYLADLLDYLIRHLRENGNEILMPRLAQLFHQPFGDLPLDCSAVDTFVSLARLCVEVLRQKAARDGVNLSAPIARHSAQAYQELLTQTGVSYTELRLARSAGSEQRQALGDRLGIDPAHLNELLIAAPDETNLQTVFGFRSTDPAAALGGQPILLQRRIERLRLVWQAQDASRTAPVLDPDLIAPEWVKDTAAVPLFQAFAAEVEALFAQLKSSVTTQQALNGALSSSNLSAGGTVVFHALGLDAAQFDAQWQLRLAGKPFDPAFLLDSSGQPIDVTAAELDRLLATRELLRTGQSDGQDLEEAWQILTRIEKRRHLAAIWRARENTAQVTVSPDFFHPSAGIAEALRTAPDDRSASFDVWRVDRAGLRDWLRLLQTREQQVADQTQAIHTVVEQVEENTLPQLRDDCIQALGLTADKVTNKLLINASASGCQKTTRAAQAIETLQLLMWGIRSRQFEDLRLALDAPNFDEEWKWLGTYASWRSAMIVFLYPENVLYPNLYQSDSPAFNAARKIISGQLAPNSMPLIIGGSWNAGQGADTDAEEEQQIARAALDKLGSLDPTSPEGIRKIIFFMLFLRQSDDTAMVSSSLRNPYFDLDRDSTSLGDGFYLARIDNMLVCPGYFGDEDGLAVYDWAKEEYELEDMLLLPLHGAITLQQRGQFQAALDLFDWVYDLLQHKLRYPRVKDLLAQRGGGSLERDDEWLADPLDPHAVAATRAGADFRFILIALVRLHLEFAEAEFARNTGDSLARARELYETAKRLLATPELGSPPAACDGPLRQLVIEVGETRYVTYILEILLGKVDIRLGDIPIKVWDDLKTDLKGVIRATGAPTPQTEAKIRKAISQVVARRLPKPSAPQRVSQVIQTGAAARQTAAEGLLANKDVYRRVQVLSTPYQKTRAAYASQAIARPPIQTDGHLDLPFTRVINPPSFTFCIPPNPLLAALRLRLEVGLFKLNNCLNLAGLARPTDPYGAPVDTASAATFTLTPGRPANVAARPQYPTQYRYRVLVERARLLISISQQMEGAYLNFMERLDQENYTILQANQHLGVARATVNVSVLKVTEAEHGKELADLQVDRAEETHEYYDELLTQPGFADFLETAALFGSYTAAAVQGVAALAAVVVGITGGATVGGVLAALPTAGAGAPAGAAGGAGAGGASALVASGIVGGGAALNSLSGALSMHANLERRKAEWEFQRKLAQIDKRIARKQKSLAKDRYDIAVEEQELAEMNAEHAADIVRFLTSKFTSAELYAWMSGIVGGVYRYFLQEATSIARLAQAQLAFELQEPEIDLIAGDYWSDTTASVSNVASLDGAGPDRRGMTGSARLTQDIYKLDQYAFTSRQSKLNVKRTISLAMLDPIVFTRFRESGQMRFATNHALFDRDFPGHYLRLIQRVRVSVIALIPPAEGIKATLSTNGISRVVVGEQGGSAFNEREIHRLPESVALSSPQNSSGVFELVEQQSELLLPFEGSGLAGEWVFEMPKAANSFDYRTIADVLVTFEYTALSSGTYRRQVIQALDPTVQGERLFSLRRNFPDQWYDLHHAAPAGGVVTVKCATNSSDFPPNLSRQQIKQVTLFFVRGGSAPSEVQVDRLAFTQIGQQAAAGGAATTVNGMVSTRQSNGINWTAMANKAPFGEWELALPAGVQARLRETSADRIDDILLSVTYSGETPEWTV